MANDCYCASERAATGFPCHHCEAQHDERKRPPVQPVDWAAWHEVGIDRHGYINDRTPCGETRCHLCTEGSEAA